MKAALQIAWREYKQYVLSRGFLLFLVIFPLSIAFVSVGVGFAEKARPERTFTVFDETGAFGASIDAEIALRRKQFLISSWDEYVKVAAEKAALDADKIAWPFAPAPKTRARIEAFHAAGFDAARAAVRPHLRKGAPPFIEPPRYFTRVDLPADVADASNAAEAAQRLKPYLLGEKTAPGIEGALFAAVVIPKGFSADADSPSAEYWSKNLTDTALEGSISRSLDTTLRRRAVSSLGLSDSALDDIMAIEAPMSSFRPDRADDEAELSVKDRVETALPAILTYMLLVVVFGVGNLLLTNTIEERSNKIVEVLLSSVTADELMLGKLIGIGAVGLTMPAIFILGGLAAAFAGAGQGAELAATVLTTLFDRNLLFVYLFYFFCAYAIFAMVFLAIGAMSNSLQDAQSFMGPVMLIVFLPLPFMIMVYENPNGLLASILTWIPIYTPYAVMMRAASDPPLWEIIGATALMLVFAVVLATYMGRIFRNAILQAAPPKAREVWELARRKDA
jgi:ABC-2 type transport system permease protein